MKKKWMFIAANLLWGPQPLIKAQVYHTGEKQDSITITDISKYIKQPDIKKIHLNNALEVLNGQSAGVNVTSNGKERLATLNSIRVRGTTSLMGRNDPLIIIDGVTSDITTLSTIYPADIESFKILKNPSETSIYGSRGASGVIEVKTKKGTDRGFQISYDGNYGWESMAKHLNMLNADEYRNTAKAMGVYFNDKGYNTDFHKVISRIGYIHQHHLAFSGGSKSSNYRASFGFMDHQTIIKNNDYRNLVVKLDATQKAFNDKLKGEFGVYGYSSKIHDIFDTRMLFYSAATQNPTFPAGVDENGNWSKNNNASYINHPGVVLKEKNDYKDLSFNTHLKLTYEFFKDLQLSGFASYSYYNRENGQFCPTWLWAQGNVYRSESKGEDYLVNFTLNYSHKWKTSKLETNISTEFLKQTKTGLWTKAKGLPNNGFSYDNIGVASMRPFGDTGSYYENPALASIMGTINYTLFDKYKLSATFREDGSSMLGNNHTFGFFPSISASWDLKKEPLFRSVHCIDLLKLRIGYGKSGNLGNISSYTTKNTVKATGLVPINGTPTVTLGELKNTNPDLKWETSSSFNIGMDCGFWHSRLLLTADYYYSRTTNMLYNYDVPVPLFPFDKLMANIGSMSNEGIELGISLIPILRKDMRLDLNFNLTYQKNKLQSLSGTYNKMKMTASDITPIGALYGAGQNGGYNNVVYQIIGEPLGVFYLPHCKGLIQDEKGNYHYDIEDLNHDGQIDLSDKGDRYIAGQAMPKITIGSNISFRYKNYDIAVQINGAFGHKIFNGTGLAFNNMANFPAYNVFKDAPKRHIVDQQISDYWLEKGNYVNLEHLTFGYNVPIKTNIIRSLRLSASVSNLFTITAYSGLTPMINSYVVNSTMGIDDKQTYPVYRTFSFGISVQF